MISKLKNSPKVVGIKQSCKAIRQGEATFVFLAENADPHLTDPIRQLCQTGGVPMEVVPTMKELGSACGISVGAAVAVLLN